MYQKKEQMDIKLKLWGIVRLRKTGLISWFLI